MPGLYDIIPGLREAEEQYRQTKLEAFAGVEPDLAGIFEVRPFTLQMFIELQLAGNGFLIDRGEPPTETDIAQFLWRISVAFERNAPEKRQGFHALLSKVGYADSVVAIYEYLARALSVMPLWPGGSGTKSACIFPAKIVHDLASAYGWTEEYILNLPLRRLWQYENRILETSHEKFAEGCPAALRLRAEWLAQQNKVLANQPSRHVRN